MNTFDRILEVGLVGLGKMGILHASILNTMPNVHLAALCDKSWVMRKLAKQTLKQTLVTDKLDEMAKLGLDVVYVTTPIPSHYVIIKEICEKNIAPNVFVEKTLSSSYPKSEELCKLVGNSNGCNMVGYMKRFAVTFRKAKELLKSGALGDIAFFEAFAYSSDFFGIKKEGVSNARGGVLEDLGSHVSDLALWFFDDSFSSIRVLSSTTESSFAHFEVEGLDNLKGRFDVSWAKEGYRMPEFGLIIQGTKGALKVDDTQLTLTLDSARPKKWYRQDLDDHVTFLLGDSEYFRENEHFIKAIIFKEKCEPDFQTASKVDYLLEQVRGIRNE